MGKLLIVTILGTALMGVLVGTVLVSLIEWGWRMKATRSRVRARLDFVGRHAGRTRQFDADVLDQRPEWGRYGIAVDRRRLLKGKTTMQARWGA